jgi:hypothetical protein
VPQGSKITKRDAITLVLQGWCFRHGYLVSRKICRNVLQSIEN